jgi:hypothetical protein
MSPVVAFLLGILAGGVSVFALTEVTRSRLRARRRSLDTLAEELKREQQDLDARHAEYQSFSTQMVSYEELQDENAILKRDLQNIDVNLRKIELDRELQRENQNTLDERSKEVGSRYLKESVRWIGESLTPNNFVSCKQRLQKVLEACRGIGFEVTAAQEASLVEDLRQEFERAVRAAFEREEQARIKARIREEQLLEREVERELKQLDRERAAIQAALTKALAEAEDEHSSEIEGLKARLAEAESKAQRAMSQAQLTKSGNVYVISNIGSLGEGVFKIGMTRRLEPMERIKELGDASVPFPFDVHMMIASDDAPSLENALHRELHKLRINKINPRKEFFRTDIAAIRQVVEEHHGEVQFVADPEALQYRQSLEMTDEDQEYIESVYERLAQNETDASLAED